MNNNDAKVSYLAVIVTGLVAFCLSLVWYSPLLFGNIWARYRSASTAGAPMWKFFVAPLRELITAAVVTFLIVRVRPQNWRRSLLLGVVLWFGFYAVQMAGAVMWDNMPWQLGAVHAGDWLLKMLFITIALSEYHRRIGAI